MTVRGLLLLCVALPAASQDADDAVSFHRDVLPILRANCQGCHQPAKAEGDLDLVSYSGLAAGGQSGAAFVAGKPDESLLVDEISPFEDLPPSMPEDRPPLSAEDIGTIRRWIEEGAEDDTPESPPRPSREHPPVYERAPVVTSIDFSADGEHIAVSGYHEVLLHRADGSGIEARLVGLSERIESVEFSPDGKLLAVAGGAPARVGELQVWDVAKRELRLSVPVTYDTIHGASWSHDAALIAFGCSDRTVRVIDAKTGEEVLYQGAHEDWVLDTAFSTDSSHLVSVSRDRSMKLVKVETQQFIDNITSITPGALKGGLMSVDRHPERDELLIGGADGVPKVFRMYREKKRVIGDDYNLIRSYAAVPGRIFSVEWSRDGARLAIGSSSHRSGEVRVYATENEEPLWSRPTPGGVYTVAFHPDGGTVAAAGFDGIVRIFDAATGEALRELEVVPTSGEGE